MHKIAKRTKNELFRSRGCVIIIMRRIDKDFWLSTSGPFSFAQVAVRGFISILSPHCIGGIDMPRRPDTPCKHPGCPKLVSYGSMYCDDHKVLHRTDRASASKRGYDRKWQQARQRFLDAHPLCSECLKNNKYVKATVVDHIVPHRGDQKLFWDQTNWQPLCKPCHDHKTWAEDSHPTY